MAKGEPGTAIRYYQEGMKLRPDEPGFLEGLGVALSAGGNPRDAIRPLQRASEIDRQSPAPFHHLGMIYATMLNHPDSALQYFKEVVSLDPDFPDGYLNLGNTYGVLGKYRNALRAYENELRARPQSPSVLLNMAHVYVLMGMKTEARKTLQRAMKMDSTMTLPESYLKELQN
jgi:protein O-GlcNAc transferase